MMSQQDCVMILSSDNDDVQVVENASDPPERLNGENPIDKKRIPIQSAVTGKEIFEQFLDKCRSLDPSKDMEIIIKKIWKKFNGASKEYVSSQDFIALVREAITNISEGPYAQMKIVSDNLKHNKKVQTESKAKNASSSTSAEAIQNENEEEIDPKTLSHIKRLEKTLKKLHLRIQKLENDEVDLSSSDDDNSAYIQLSRYKQRICEVFKKLCELQNKDPYAERSYKKRIKFNGTNVPAVDKAIEKFYNDTKEFPDYKNILNVVQKANEVKKLNLLPHEVDALAVKAFLEFGKTLKSWRQFDDYECFHLYVKNEKDPASEDEVLKTRLEENKKKYANRIDEVIDKYALKQDEENLQPEVVNSDAKSSESEDEEEEDAESDCRSRISILEWKYNPDDSSDDSDKEIKNDINCKVVLVDVKCTPEWDKYMKRIENANIKDETNKTTTNLHSVDLENKPPWLTHKRNLSSDDESPSSKKIKTVVSLEQIPSTSKQTVPILLEDFRHVSKTTDEHRFNNKTAKNTAKAVINQNSPKSSIELQMSVDEEDDNDVIEIVSDSCDRASNENENINPCNKPKDAKNHQSSPSSSKNNNEESKNEAKAEDVPSTALDELINIEDSETKADTPTPLPKNQHSNADVCADGSATESNASPRKPSDDVICVEDAEDKNESNEPAINELSVNIISIDVSSEESKKNNNIHDIPISQSLDNVINVEECVVDNEENQSQEALIDMPLDVIITADPLAENSVSPAPNDGSSPSNVSKEEENNPSNVDNSESAAITQDSKKKTTLDKDDKLDTESTVKKPHNDKPISDEKAQPVKDNEDEIMIIDEVVKTKTPEKPVNKNDEVIDVEELSDSPQPKKFKQLTLDLSPINLTQIIRNMNFEKNVNKQNPRPRMPAPSTSFGINNARRNDVRNTRINNTVRESMICNQGTSKLTPYNHSQPSFNSKNLNSRQQLALMPSNQRVKMMNNQLGFNKNIGQPSNNRNVTGQTAQAAMHKRQCTTTHTLQRFDNKNNCMVTRKQVTTVVEESVVKISNTQTASNGNFHMVGQRTRVVNRRMQQIQKSTRPPNRGSTSQEIITLD